MFLRTKRAKAILPALFAVTVLLVMMVPTVASAYITDTRWTPYRGSNYFTKASVYAKCRLDSSGEIYRWMQVSVYLYEEYPEPGMWWGIAEDTDTDENCRHEEVSEWYVHPDAGTFMSNNHFEWNLYNVGQEEGYQHKWLSAGPKALPAV